MTLLSKLYGNVKIFNISSPFSNIALRMLKVQSEVLGAVESSICRCISPQEGQAKEVYPAPAQPLSSTRCLVHCFCPRLGAQVICSFRLGTAIFAFFTIFFSFISCFKGKINITTTIMLCSNFPRSHLSTLFQQSITRQNYNQASTYSININFFCQLLQTL